LQPIIKLNIDTTKIQLSTKK